MKYPRYTREENRACKLTQQQIDDIPILKSQDLNLKNIADLYGVTPQAIFYWLLNEDERKRRVRAQIDNAIRQPFDFVAYRKRKKELHPELIEYENQFDNEYKLKNRPKQKETVRKAGHNRWLKHKGRLTLKNKEYQLAHLDKFREYNKRYRKNHPERVKELAKKSYVKYRERKLAHQREQYRKNHPVVIRIR